MFLEVCHQYLHISRSRHLLPSLRPAFGRVPLVTLRLSRSFCSGTCSVFFPLLWQNPLARLPSLHPVEPGCVLENLTYASLKTFSPRTARSGQLSARTQLARKGKPSLAALGNACWESATRRRGLWVRSVKRWWYPWVCTDEVSPVAPGQARRWSL